MDKHFSDIINTFKKLDEAPSYNPNTMPANPGGTQTSVVAKQVSSNNDSTGMSQHFAHLADKDEKTNLLAFQKGMMNAQLELDIARKLGGKPPTINSRGTGIFSHMNTTQFGQWLASHPDAYKAFSDDPQKNQSAPVKQNVPPSQQVAQNQQAQSSMAGLAEGQEYEQGVAEGDGDEAYVACIVQHNRSGRAMVQRTKPISHERAEEVIRNALAKNTFVHPPFMTIYPASAGKLDGSTIMAQFPDMSQKGLAETKSESKPAIYQGQFKTKEEALNYAKESVKKYRDPEDGIEIWAMPSGGFDVVATMNSNGRNHTIKNGGKKLGTIGPRYKGVTEDESTMSRAAKGVMKYGKDDQYNEGSMDDAEHNPEGPKFSGYWKGTDKNPPKSGMGVGGTSESTEYQGFRDDGRKAAIHGKPNENPFTEPREKKAAAAWQKGYDSYKPKVGHSISTNNKSHKGIVERVDNSHVYFRTSENKLFRTKSRNVHQTVEETIIASSGTGTAPSTPNPEAVAANSKASNDVMNKLKSQQLVDPKQQSAVKKALDPTANAGGDLSKMNPQAKAGSAGEGMKILGALQQAAKPAGQGGDPAKLNQITKMIGDLNKKAQM